MQSELEGFATLSPNAADSEQNVLDVYSVPMQESTAAGHDRARSGASRPVYPTATRYPRDAHVVSGMLMGEKLRSSTRFRLGPISFSATFDVIAPVFGQRSEIIVCIILYTFSYE